MLRTYESTMEADIYAFGVLMYEIITGKHPFENMKAADIVDFKLSNAPTADQLLVPKDRTMPATLVQVRASHCFFHGADGNMLLTLLGASSVGVTMLLSASDVVLMLALVVNCASSSDMLTCCVCAKAACIETTTHDNTSTCSV
jgi:serine/threonine protein kinase